MYPKLLLSDNIDLDIGPDYKVRKASSPNNNLFTRPLYKPVAPPPLRAGAEDHKQFQS